MVKFLLDASLSPETSQFLKNLGYDTKDLISSNLYSISDEKIVKLAIKERRIIITFDLDFGELYHFKFKSKVGIIILRTRDQTVESVHKILKIFLQRKVIEKQKLEKSLIIVDETRFRVY